MASGGLTSKQRAFVDAYVGEAKQNATLAYRMAGYSSTGITARATASQLLANPNVRSEIDAVLNEIHSSAVSGLKSATQEAVDVLRGLLKSENEIVQHRSAVTIIEQGYKGISLLEMEARMRKIEEALNGNASQDTES